MTLKDAGDFIYRSEDRFFVVFYTALAAFCVALVLTACSTDVHGVRIDAIRKQPDMQTTVVVPPAQGPAGGS